jgi:tetratricopeptide (TPR) repeat protein
MSCYRERKSALGSFKRKVSRTNNLKLVEKPKPVGETTQTGLSIAIMVRKKNGVVRSFVESLKNIVNEIILIDVVSGDQTKKLANELGINYYEAISLRQGYELGLRKAKSSTVLFMYENETIANPVYLTNLNLDESDIASVYMQYEETNAFEAEPSVEIRLFKKKLAAKWTSDFFGSVWDSLIKLDSNLGITKLMLSAPGGTPSESMMRKDNTELRKELKVSSNAYTAYQLGRNLVYLDQYEQAKSHLEPLLKKWDDSISYHSHVVKLLAQIYLHTRDFDQAELLLNKGIESYPLYTDLAYLNAKLFVEKKEYNQAKELITSIDMTVETPGMYYRDLDLKGKINELSEQLQEVKA